jgi:hypothetical protein
MAAVSAREQRPPGRRWAQQSGHTDEQY